MIDMSCLGDGTDQNCPFAHDALPAGLCVC